MSQEDDLRGLAKVMDFMRALSILFVIINIYWSGIENTAQLPAYYGTVSLQPVHQTLLRGIPRSFLSGD